MSGTPVLAAQRRALLTVARNGIREAVRRRVVAVVGALTVAFLVLYSIAANFAFDEVADPGSPFRGAPFGVAAEQLTLTGSTLLGLAMFTTLFLGAVLTTFLTLGVVRGDAEVGLLQPIVARPLGRPGMLLARWLASAAIASIYVVVVFAAAVVITDAVGGWSPDQPLAATLELAGAVCVIAAISVGASVFLSGTAQGIAVLMVFGAGLTAGLLGQIGNALRSPTLVDIGEGVSTALPFELLYQDALYRLTADSEGFARVIVDLGPFGGAQEAGAGGIAWAAVFILLALLAAAAAFARRDL